MTTQANSDSLPNGTRIGRSTLRVSDLEELTEFYRDIVGLSILRRVEQTAVLGVDETPLLVLEGDEDAHTRHRTGTGLYHNAFRVPSRAALGDALTRIRTHWQLDGGSDHRVSEALYLTDPEENGIEIYRDFPRKEWPMTSEGRVRMGTDPLDLASVEADARGDDRMPLGTIIGHIHLEVSSLETFRDFYVDTLGFAVQMAVPETLFVSAGGYHHHLGANTWHHRTKYVEGRALSGFEILVPDPHTLDVVRDRIANHGIPVTDTDDGIAAIDPDDIEVRLRVEPPQ